jgi:hypothetical protein
MLGTRHAFGCVIMLALAACSGESVPPPAVPRVDAARSTLTAGPPSATANGVDAVTLRATASDASGAPLSGLVATFAVTGASTLSSATATTGADGVATVTLRSTAAGEKEVAVSIDGVAVTAHATATFVAGPAASLAFTVQPSDVVAGEFIAPAVQVTVLDAFDNVVGGPTQVTLGLSGGPAGAELLGTTTAEASAGSAHFADLSVRAAGTGYVLTASSAEVTSATSDAFSVTVAAPAVAMSDVAAHPTSLVAGGMSDLTATIRDAFGNPVAGATVAFEATGSSNTISDPTAANSSGVAAGTLTSTKAEAKTVTARIGTLALGDDAVVTFTAGAPALAGSSLAASPTSVPAGGTPITLTALVGDAYGNPVPGQSVTFSSSGTAVFTRPAAVTGTDGATTGSVSASRPAYRPSPPMSARCWSHRPTSRLTAVPSASASTVLVSPSSVPADGTTVATVTVTVREALGQPVAGVTVALANSGSATIAPATATTSAAGVATFLVRSSTAGSGTLTAKVNPGAGEIVLDQTATLEFTVPTYVIAGSVGGLTASGLELATAGQTDVAVPAGATTFAFAERVPPGTAYAITAKAQPSGQTCTVVNGNGTVANGDVSDVVVDCVDTLNLPPLTWTWVPIEGSMCWDGSPTGIGIEVGPGASPNVLVFLDGGGACWDYMTCWVLRSAPGGPFGAAELEASVAARAGSVLDRTVPGNPYADYTFVFVPYCTGDVHSGATSMTYAPASQAWRHTGRVNVSNAFQYLASALRAPPKVVVSGSSAGGFGSFHAFTKAKAAWPTARSFLVDDSGPPLANIPTTTVAAWYASWDLGAVVADVCGAPCATDPPTLAPVLPALAAAHPTERFALLSSTQDQVIRTFFTDPKTLQPMAPAVFEASLRELAAAIEDDSPETPPGETHAFVVSGTTHPMLDRPGRFTSQGVTLLEWLRRQVEDDPAWAAAIPPPP